MSISPDKTGMVETYNAEQISCYKWASGRKSLRINQYEIDLTEEQYKKLFPLFPSMNSSSSKI
jgi:hypothetical protein